MISHASTAYISASTNRHPHAAAASRSGLVTCASHKFLALWDTTNGRGVIETLPGHDGEVTIVKSFGSDAFVSGDKLGQVRIWRRGDKWTSSHHWQAHKQPISALAVSKGIILTGSSDATLKSWHHEVRDGADQVTEGQIVDLKRRYPLDVAITTLPNSSALIIAVASTSRTIDLYVRPKGQPITFALTLEGHEDWIRSLAFSSSTSETDDAPTLTLASGSQDMYIRLWVIKPSTPSSSGSAEEKGNDVTDELLDAFERSLNQVNPDEGPSRQLSTREHIFSVRSSDSDSDSQTYSVAFDALLVGHEASVNSVSWRPTPSPSPASGSAQQLLSSSTDASLIVWSPVDAGAGAIWNPTQRFGDVGGQRAGGFVGALWVSAAEVAGWGWGGGWRRWKQDEAEAWREFNAPTGHNAPVRGIGWSPQGEYLVSTSQDQTTRIHGPAIISPSSSITWHELSRPQVHGYDLTDAAFVGPGSLRLVSSADEKIARVFEAPKGFVRAVRALGTVNWEGEQASEESRPAGASLPPLGLSNKATESAETSDDDAEVPTHPPFEGELATMTLWPETEKLFGHGYELHTLAVSPSGEFVATACRATTREHAVVRLHSSDNWQPVGAPLAGHSLTITRIAFSHDERMVLSVSRDRSWRVFRRVEGTDAVEFEPVAEDSSHSRIIWDCAWSSDDKIFVTASRDKTVRIWSGSGSETLGKALATIKLKEAATAVALTEHAEKRILAIGLENGHVLLYSSPLNTANKWTNEATLDSSIASVGHVHRLSWQPSPQQTTNRKKLAMCSEDRTMRILEIEFK